MATRAEHYAKAEELLLVAEVLPVGTRARTEVVIAANVHALLATASSLVATAAR